MKERGRYQIQFMKTRSSSGVGQKVDLEFNVDTLRISDLGEDEDGGYNGGSKPQQTQGSIYSNLKRTSTVSTTTDPETGEIIDVDPNKGSSLKINKPSTSAPLMRSMLSNLNPEKD
jgi:hypothetical protein